MITYIGRRLLAIVGVLLVASFVVYSLTAAFGDPLADLKGSNDPNRDKLIADRIAKLNLDQPIPLRYLSWLSGAAGCFIGRCDLGVSYIRGDQPVTEALAAASMSTISLVTWSVVIAAILGIAIGMITALRQYSGFDYVTTFVSFVFYSLPIFWVAVLLKEFGAIQLNQFFDNPQVSITAYVIIFVLFGLIGGSVMGGDIVRRGLSFLVAGAAPVLVLWALVQFGWFQNPGLGIPGIILFGAAISLVTVTLSHGLSNKRALAAAGTTVAIWTIAWYPLQYLFYATQGRNPIMQPWILWALLLVAIGLGIVSGLVWGKDDKRQLARTGAIVSALTFAVVVIDMLMTVYPFYKQAIPQKYGWIGTIGAVTPGFSDKDMWMQMLDSVAHLLLPTIALTIVAFAGWTRYTRATLLEVLNLDYVRTARAKGLNERTVVMRHAFRNMLIPITTIIAFDIGGLLGGAIITEQIFAWEGMGQLFNQGLARTDVNLVMGYFLLVGFLTILFNLIADISYTLLDPRIRVK
jgi:peptide/nickel transport system permease protein